MTLNERDLREIEALRKEFSLVEISAHVDRHGFWCLSGTHSGEIKVMARGKIWTPTRNDFREAYHKANTLGMFKTKETA